MTYKNRNTYKTQFQILGTQIDAITRGHVDSCEA